MLSVVETSVYQGKKIFDFAQNDSKKRLSGQPLHQKIINRVYESQALNEVWVQTRWFLAA
jgi:hypothetical protein